MLNLTNAKPFLWEFTKINKSFGKLFHDIGIANKLNLKSAKSLN